MKSTGVVRKLDKLGRIVIPIEMRKTLDINLQDPLEIFSEGNNIILRKYAPGCVFCGEVNNTIQYKGKLVCQNCVNQLQPTGQPLEG